MGAVEREWRERVAKACLRAERDFAPGDIAKAANVARRSYSQFKSENSRDYLRLDREKVRSLEAFCQEHGYMDDNTGPYTDATPSTIEEIRQWADAIKTISVSPEGQCTVSDLEAIRVAAVRIAETLVPRALHELGEEDN